MPGANPSSPSTIDKQSLPDELLLTVFRHLPFQELCRVSQASKSFATLASDPSLWHALSVKRWKLGAFSLPEFVAYRKRVDDTSPSKVDLDKTSNQNRSTSTPDGTRGQQASVERMLASLFEGTSLETDSSVEREEQRHFMSQERKEDSRVVTKENFSAHIDLEKRWSARTGGWHATLQVSATLRGRSATERTKER
ncbi:hypothetical protein M427DRAFT_56397 [Gonapodya prolifera JEL478]|uniref:F-box domain-containing protein n=1 Tax=Gonapodya prolifera (strain JEL478) TaxID=1344416 RepID=A0A139AHA6_GONPJ|nr:hypothetical protein M427DRAFT_56397 [Gonapodya prolifera JEL478]|eukprot:KXS15825.1 hypothetical protein M427DRAFT_56397 [Gonapodya prolifera JEL478]